MLPPLAKIFRRQRGWLATGALLALVPKCFVCLAAYLTAGAALGVGGRELCGGPVSATGPSTQGMLSLAMLGVVGFLAIRSCRRAPAATNSALNPPPIRRRCWKQTAQEFLARRSGPLAGRFSFRDWRRRCPTPQNARS